MGVSVVGPEQEMLSAEIQLREDVSDKVRERRMYRRSRRYRLRYRKARFLNRKHRRAFAPRVTQKVQSHLKIIEKIDCLLPITQKVMEANSFDPHRLKNPAVSGAGYQQGDQFWFENVKAFVLDRDGYHCYFNQACSRKLHVHHIVHRSEGGSGRPENLLTLCEKHHKQIHQKEVWLPAPKPKSFKPPTVMNLIRNQVLKNLPELRETFGYITKAIRRGLTLEKSHVHDAFIIAGGLKQSRMMTQNWFFKRKNSRVLQTNRKGFSRCIRRQRYAIQPHDIVRWNGKLYRAVGVQNRGAYLKFTDGVESLVKQIKHIQVVFHQKTLVVGG